jgi:hypothetical protein
MVTKEEIKSFLSHVNLKKTKVIPGVYFEQKITPDVLSFTASCILKFANENKGQNFGDKEIRGLDFFKETTKTYFSKPGQTSSTENEYNKFTSYHLSLLAFAKILDETSKRPRKYKIHALNLVEFISQSDRNALDFLEVYVEKLLQDNDLTIIFNIYKQKPNFQSYKLVKDKFWQWAKQNTLVKGDEATHTNRVFNKIFNIFAYSNHLSGEEKASIKPGPCPYGFLIYNRINFRDIRKPRGISRTEYAPIRKKQMGVRGWIGYLTNLSKKAIRSKYSVSEVNDPAYAPEARGKIQIHHIFMGSEYLKFSHYHENLIAITAGQHNSYAHDRSTRDVNKKFQVICLLAKLNSLKVSLSNHDSFYNLSKFIELLNECLSLQLPTNSTLNAIKEKLEEINAGLT